METLNQTKHIAARRYRNVRRVIRSGALTPEMAYAAQRAAANYVSTWLAARSLLKG